MEIGLGCLVWRLRVHHEPHAQAESPHLGAQGSGIADLHMHRAGVGTGLAERLEIIPGVVIIKWQSKNISV